MVETITPAVYGGRARWVGAVTLHAFGAALTAATFGAALGLVGSLLAAPFGRAGTLVVAALALVYAASTLPTLSVPVPQLRRQVPDWWRTFFSPPMTAFLYGAGLGIGFLTFLPGGGLVVVSVAALVSGSPAVGAVIVGAFGLARGLSAVSAARVDTTDQGARMVERLAGRSDVGRRSAEAASLVVVVAAALASAARFPTGGWSMVASALLTVAFAAAVTAKLAALRRWRRTLAAHRLPSAVEYLVVWAVPAAEALVVLAALLGYRRASAAAALLLLTVFSAEVVRVRLASPEPVPCGCFGGRRVRPAWQVLTRNVGLAVLAGAALYETTAAPLITWPGVPGPGELLPASLAAGAIVASLLLAWQGMIWLGRGRR